MSAVFPHGRLQHACPQADISPVFRGRGGGSYPQAAARLRRACPAFFKKWHWWATHSRLAPMRRAAHTLKNHWRGIANAITGENHQPFPLRWPRPISINPMISTHPNPGSAGKARPAHFARDFRGLPVRPS
ncbi:MAG: transposase [Lentisphaeria bacterium]